MTVERGKRKAEAGFTLIETLVALAVLATSAVALVGATQAHINRIAGLEQRAAAQWAGENAVAETALGVDVSRQPATMLGYEFQLQTERAVTADASVDKVSILVKEVEGVTIAHVIGFILKSAAPQPELP